MYLSFSINELWWHAGEDRLAGNVFGCSLAGWCCVKGESSKAHHGWFYRTDSGACRESLRRETVSEEQRGAEVVQEIKRELQTRVCMHVCGRRGRGGRVYSAFMLSRTNLQQLHVWCYGALWIYLMIPVCMCVWVCVAFLSVRAGCNEALDLGQERFRAFYLFFSVFFFFYCNKET